jgi:hypothetical protein
VVRQVAIIANAIVIERKVLVIVAKMQPLSGFAVPVASAGISYVPMGKCCLIEIDTGRNVIDDQVEVFKM